jgi:arylformamidase
MRRIIDLTLPLGKGDRGVEIEPTRLLERDGWNASTLSLYSHCGTHMDAPAHFGVGRQTIDKLPVEKLMGSAWVVDVRPVLPRALIGVEHMRSIADRFQAEQSILVCTGWSDYYGQDRYREELPRISLELAEWCVERRVQMLGVEPPSVADVNNIEELTAVHRALFAGGVIVVEGLANLASLKATQVTFIALPLRISEGDGSPARALAIEEY